MWRIPHNEFWNVDVPIVTIVIMFWGIALAMQEVCTNHSTSPGIILIFGSVLFGKICVALIRREEDEEEN